MRWGFKSSRGDHMRREPWINADGTNEEMLVFSIGDAIALFQKYIDTWSFTQNKYGREDMSVAISLNRLQQVYESEIKTP